MIRRTEMTRGEQIEILAQRDGFNCFHPDCGKPFKEESDITLDHWIPQSRGGTWATENLRLMHKRCNAIKGDRMPNEDGTLPTYQRDLNSSQRRAIKRAERVTVCQKCNSGRNLDYGEQCATCGSGPMPAKYPQWAQMPPKECDHDMFHCWACILGMYPRRAAIHDVVNSSELDEG